MGKSAKKSASKVAAGAVVAAPAPAPAKREAEVVVIEKELASAKKQKVVAGNKSEKKKFVKKKIESDNSESEQKPKADEAPAAQKKDESDSDEEVLDSSDEEEVSRSAKEERNKKAGEHAKTLFVGNLSLDVKQADVEEFFKPAGKVVAVRLAMRSRDGSFRGFGHVVLATAEQAKKALRELNGKKLLQRAVRLDQAKENTPNKKAEEEAEEKKEEKKEQSTVGGGGSKTLFVGNLSFDVKQTDVEEFFKPAGEVVAVCFAKKHEDDSFRGFGHVEFATAEQAEKALRELNGKELLKRAVRLDLANVSPAESGQGKDDSQRGSSKPEAVFVRGFDSSEGEDKIRSLLTAHFSSCGEIARISIPAGEDGNSKGFAYVQFLDDDSRNKALALNGSESGNDTLTVLEPKPRGDSNGGRGRGRGRGGFGGGGRGGRGRGDFGGGRGGRGRGSGRRGGGRGRSN